MRTNDTVLKHYDDLLVAMSQRPAMERWAQSLPDQIRNALSAGRHGDWPRWERLIHNLPATDGDRVELNTDIISVTPQTAAKHLDTAALESALQGLHPWRKGPYRIHDVLIDTEWRSDMKWRRLEKQITPLAKRWVLDVGCGSGYHAWRMRGAGAAQVLGIDPGLLNVAQFLAIRHFIGQQPVDVLPLGIEALPPGLRAFDSVFSMGVLYHRRSPLDHLLELKDTLRPGGELILETLVIPGKNGEVLLPADRYASMRNVWFLPSPDTLAAWLERCGFRNVRIIDVSKTTPAEQRATAWMRFHSLSDFLDPQHPDLTLEGHPAPCRAIAIAIAP